MLIPQIQDLVRDHYVLADVAPQIAAGLDDLHGPATERLDAPAFAETVTAALQSVSTDRHLRVRHYPDGVPRDQDEADVRAHFAALARVDGPGITEVRRLEGNVGLLGIGPVILPPEWLAPAASAAFTLFDGVERLVLDLRGCIGGVPSSVALLVSHLMGEEKVHLQDVVERDGTAEASYTTPEVAPRMPDVPVCVLTSARTFSGGEELAYDLQALGRARVVGETTMGGAHPRRGFDLTPHLQLHVPVARSVNAATGTNWEGVGVTPDHPCSANTALGVALALLG